MSSASRLWSADSRVQSVRIDVFEHLSQQLAGCTWVVEPGDGEMISPSLEAKLGSALKQDRVFTQRVEGSMPRAGNIMLFRDAGNRVTGMLKVYKDRFDFLEELAAQGMFEDGRHVCSRSFEVVNLVRFESSTGIRNGVLMRPDSTSAGLPWLQAMLLDGQPHDLAKATQALASLGASMATFHRDSLAVDAPSQGKRDMAASLWASLGFGINDLIMTGVPVDSGSGHHLRTILNHVIQDYLETPHQMSQTQGGVRFENLFAPDAEFQFRPQANLPHEQRIFSDFGTDYGYVCGNIASHAETFGLGAEAVERLQRSFLESYRAGIEIGDREVETALRFHGARVLASQLAGIASLKPAVANPLVEAQLVHEQRRVFRMLFEHLDHRAPPEFMLPESTVATDGGLSA